MDRKKKDDLPKMQVGFIDFICMPVYKVSCKWSDEYGAFSHVVASAISVFQNNETMLVMLVFQTNHLRVEHLSYVTSFFVSSREWKRCLWICVLEPAEWRHICKEDQYMLSDQWSRKCWIIRYNLVVCTVQWTNFEPVKIGFFKRFLLHCRHRFLVSFNHLHSALYNWTTRVSLSKIRSGMF